MAHDWASAKARGQAGERLALEWMHLQGFQVEAIPDTDPRQRQGLDFIVTDGSHTWSVELKSCSRGDVTGNIFLEILSVNGDGDRQERLGWLHTCEADWLYYFLVYSRKMMVFRMDALRDLMPVWSAYPTKRVQNKRYHGEGWIVPVHVVAQHAEMVVRL